MTDAAVAALVERGDPERWRTAMTAPPAARPGLMALYAFNLEVARAPWVASEAMLAEIRLRWWLDALAEIYDGQAPRRHEVVEPLAAVIGAADLPRRLFEEMVAARAADAVPEPLADRGAVDLYIDHTAGHLMELAARSLGAEGAALPVVRDFARGAGTAALLRALPDLRARGRDPLPAGGGGGRAGARRARGDRPGARASRAGAGGGAAGAARRLAGGAGAAARRRGPRGGAAGRARGLAGAGAGRAAVAGGQRALVSAMPGGRLQPFRSAPQSSTSRIATRVAAAMSWTLTHSSGPVHVLHAGEEVRRQGTPISVRREPSVPPRIATEKGSMPVWRQASSARSTGRMSVSSQ